MNWRHGLPRLRTPKRPSTILARRVRTLLVLLALLALSLPVSTRAGGGFGGLVGTSLQVQAGPEVRRVALDLALSLTTIKAQEVYRNTGTEPVTGDLSLSLPPISLAELAEDLPFALPREQLTRDNPLAFAAMVEDRPVAVTVQRLAVQDSNPRQEQPSTVHPQPSTADVTPVLLQLGIPLTLDTVVVATILEGLPQTTKEQLQALGLADFPADGPPAPHWSLVLRYRWSQVFPPGQDLRVTHQYQAAPPGELVSWPYRSSSAHQRRLLADTCVSAATRTALTRRLGPGPQGPGAATAFRLDYLLTAGATPQLPLESFRLTIDKGAPTNILSLCAPGLRQTGPTTWLLEQHNIRPRQDLHLLIVTAPID